MESRLKLKDKNRIIIKIGTSSLTHVNTGHLDLEKMEKLIRVLTNLRNKGKEVVLVTSGSIAVGRAALKLKERPKERNLKQACAAVGQARLMMVYQKLFSEYSQTTAQILMTKHTMVDKVSRLNAQNTFNSLFEMGVIPIVNENDTISTDELGIGDNDTLSAIVTALVGGDVLILLSDIDGLYTDDPNENPDAKFVPYVDELGDYIFEMGKSSSGDVGTGGMSTKILAAQIANDSGADMIIANGGDVSIINHVLEGKDVGTFFKNHKVNNFNVIDYLKEKKCD